MNVSTQSAATPVSEDADTIIRDLGKKARGAATAMASTASAQKNEALKAAAARLRCDAASVLAANAEDMERARERGINSALLDRLHLDKQRIDAIADTLEQVARLPDPVGRVLASWTRPNGLEISRLAVPIGVVGVIYESRPNVTADAAALCLKAGNAVILRGGSEAAASNLAIYRVIAGCLESAGLDPAAIQMVPDQSRALVGALLRAHQWVDVIVPRGGRSLIERVQGDARVPVFAHLDGNNHLYIHSSAEPRQAVEVVVNAKMRRPGICGAVETVLIDAGWLNHLPALVEALVGAGCELRGDERLRALDARIRPATEQDWKTEYLDAVLAMAKVDGLDEALAHIARYGSGHTDGILSGDQSIAEKFLARVDSAIVVHNASNQFADGGEFGLGAEIGIATGRLHARGPVGLEQLTTFKYQLRGQGQVRP